MRILIFIIWIAVGIIYFFIWSMRENCCDRSKSSQSPPVLESTQNQSLSNTLQQPSESETTTSISKQESSTSPIAIPVIGTSCIKFKWADSQPITDSCFLASRDSVLSSLEAGQILEIIGAYFEKENKIMASGDLGLLRASGIKEMVVPSIPADNIKIRSTNLGDTINVNWADINLINFKPVFQNDQIKELDDKTMIYFKFGSNAGVNDVLVNQYVTHLAKKLKKNNHTVLITGHTDDDASADHNLKLGLKRANIIKNLLTDKGIKASRIKTNSKGEEMPIAPNDTEENRKLNRRVEVVILPSAKHQ